MYPIRQKVYMPCAHLLKNNNELIPFRKANLFVTEKVTGVASINKKPKSIKTDISRLRTSIKRGLVVDTKTLIQNIVDQEDDYRYRWNPIICV